MVLAAVETAVAAPAGVCAVNDDIEISYDAGPASVAFVVQGGLDR